MGISAHVGHFEGLAGRKKHCRAWAFFRAFSKVVWAGPKNTEFDYILGKKWDMSFLFGHKSGHFRRGRCRKKAKYWAFRAFSSEIVVGRMSGIFRQILGIFRANHLVTLQFSWLWAAGVETTRHVENAVSVQQTFFKICQSKNIFFLYISGQFLSYKNDKWM